MTTLSDQLVIVQYQIDHVASRDDILHETVVSGMVGSGTERHLVRATIWAAKPERPHSLAGRPGMPDRIAAKPAGIGGLRVNCGAQRAMSSIRSVSLTAPITCERCLGAGQHRFGVESMPTDVITTDKRGNLVPVEA